MYKRRHVRIESELRNMQIILIKTGYFKRFPEFACTIEYWVIDEDNVPNLDNCKMLCQYCYVNAFLRPIEKIKDASNFSRTLSITEQLRWHPVSMFTGFSQLPHCCNVDGCSFAPEFRESVSYYTQPFSQTLRAHMLCPACYETAHRNKNISQFDILMNDCENCGNTTANAQKSFRKIREDIMKSRVV